MPALGIGILKSARQVQSAPVFAGDSIGVYITNGGEGSYGAPARSLRALIVFEAT